MVDRDDEYPLSEVVRRSSALVKPDPRVKCQRCPNATWIVDLKLRDPGDAGAVEYGDDEVLRAQCAAIHAKWVWPQYNVADCDARRQAIRAERRNREK